MEYFDINVLDDKHFNIQVNTEIRNKIVKFITATSEKEIMNEETKKITTDNIIDKYIPKKDLNFYFLYNLIDETFIKIGKKTEH